MARQIVSEMGNWFNFIAEPASPARSRTAWAASGITIARLLPFCVIESERRSDRRPLPGARSSSARTWRARSWRSASSRDDARPHVARLSLLGPARAAHGVFRSGEERRAPEPRARRNSPRDRPHARDAVPADDDRRGAGRACLGRVRLPFRVRDHAVSFVAYRLCVARIPEEALHATGDHP